MNALFAYLPQNRLRALARGEALPDRALGSALFADISGFTPLTEALREALGPRRGAEALSQHLEAVYAVLIAQVEKYGGSVLGFAGDAITCWFDAAELPNSAAPACQAVACALALQAAMQHFPQLGLKVAVTTGLARRFVVGDPTLQLLDVLAGETLARLAAAEQLAQRGEVVVDKATSVALGANLTVREWRLSAERNARFAVVAELLVSGYLFAEDTLSNHQSVGLAQLLITNNNSLRPFLLRAVYERETSGQGAFLTEFRPCAALFVRWTGIDYDTDAAATQLNTFVQQAQTIAQRYDGAFLQITLGDKGSYAYIVFGALSIHEDTARRTLKTALELREAAAKLGFLAALQMGVAQGVMRVGAYGGPTRRTYGALGDEVNLAARLMEAAAPGEILVSEVVQKEAQRWFTFAPRPTLTLKGKAEAQRGFALLAERAQPAIHLLEPHYALPMTGRQKELQLIAAKLALARSAQAQVVGIVAEAGMGKSRLVAEVIRLAREQGFVGYGGACQSDGTQTAYLVWQPIWRAFFGADAATALQLSHLETAVVGYAPERRQAVPLLGPVLNEVLPENEFTQPLSPQFRQSALYALLEDCVRAAARAAPLLIVIEDLHWIDALALDLLEALGRALTDSRVCFVLVYRPLQAQRLQAPQIEVLPHFTKVELAELSLAECEQALRAKLALLYPEQPTGTAPQLLEKLAARAQGNPFYLEELLNFLHDRGLNPADPTALEKIELPDSLHTLILSRINHLTEHEKTTLRVASIIGRLFRAGWLTGYYPALGDVTQIKASLHELEALDITPLDTPEPELAYLFKHMVTHEVTYESLPFATRAQLHAQLAQYLEQQIAVGALAEAPLLNTLVHHYLRSNNLAKQREYLRKAGAAALKVSAFQVASAHFARLLELVAPEDADRSALALQLAEAHYRLSNYSAARTAVEQAQAAATTMADRATALAFLGEMTSELGNYPAAQGILAEAVPLAKQSGDDLTLCRTLYALGDVLWRLGKLHEAQGVLEESLALARALGEATRELFALNRLGAIALQQDLAEAERLYHEVYARALAVGNRERAMVALNNLGAVAFDAERHNNAAARGYYQQALTLARELGAQQSIALYLINLAGAAIGLGELATARGELRAGLALALRLGVWPWVVFAVMYAAYLAHAEGHTERALALVGLAQRHPAWGSDHQDSWAGTLARWGLDPAVVAVGLAQGATLDWDETIRELLADGG